ncbi:MAG: zinc ribbon domain-containing protein [Desulfobacterales bacterium]|nr:zinc ribbon domain-containing protein [Desulfobacterales bacterium]MBF0396815.1 zinc ribbon domain-containing protein [Desulfobacterales bacterium]
MPIYEYECTSCGKIEEVFQRFSDTPIVECKQCSGQLQKLISQSSFHLKGSGWYVTDYSKKSGSNSSSPKNSEESKPATDTGTTSAKTTESKTSD